jgi:hypothetical protein
MREHYRKWGRVVRYEHGRVIRVEEAGEAIESTELFLASPIAERVVLLEVDEGAVVATARAIETLVTAERLLVSDGVAEHEYDGIRWQERTRRVHVALVIPSVSEGPVRTGGAPPMPHRSLATLGMRSERALIDLDSFDLDVLRRIAHASPAPQRNVERVRFAPHVEAALLPHLIGRIELEQLAAPHDGKGLPVERRDVEGEPPNWYRPSYRVRPHRAWLNLRARRSAIVHEEAPLAVAILGALDPNALRLLCLDGEEIFPAVVDAQTL